jgi:peptidyl-tRNA hydrolase
MVGERMVQYLNAVAIPTTKAVAAAASVVSSAVFYPFEQAGGQRNTLARSAGDSNLYPTGTGWLNAWGNFGAAKVVLRAADKTKVTSDSVIAKIYVSFDK